MHTCLNRLFLISVLLLSGCAGRSEQPTNIPILSALTQTPSPAISRETPTAVAIPTSLPTLSPLEVDDTISALMTSNGNCSEPCFWGLVPGITTIKDGVDFIQGFGKTVLTGQRGLANYFTTSVVYNNEMVISLTLWERNGLLGSLNVDIGSTNNDLLFSNLKMFAPQNLLRTYGRPNDVSFYLSQTTEPAYSDSIDYGYILTYSDFTVEYYGQRVSLRNPIIICPLVDQGLVGVKLWFGKNIIDPPVYGVDLELATSLTVNDYYNLMLIEANEACISLDVEAFPP